MVVLDEYILIYDAHTLQFVTRIQAQNNIGDSIFDYQSPPNIYILTTDVEYWEFDANVMTWEYQNTFSRIDETSSSLLHTASITSNNDLIVSVDHENCLISWNTLTKEEFVSPIYQLNDCNIEQVHLLQFSPDDLYLSWKSVV